MTTVDTHPYLGATLVKFINNSNSNLNNKNKRIHYPKRIIKSKSSTFIDIYLVRANLLLRNKLEIWFLVQCAETWLLGFNSNKDLVYSAKIVFQMLTSDPFHPATYSWYENGRPTRSLTIFL